MTGRQFKAVMGLSGNSWIQTYCSVKPGQHRPQLDFYDLSIPGVLDKGGFLLICNERMMATLMQRGGEALVKRAMKYFTFVD